MVSLQKNRVATRALQIPCVRSPIPHLGQHQVSNSYEVYLTLVTPTSHLDAQLTLDVWPCTTRAMAALFLFLPGAQWACSEFRTVQSPKDHHFAHSEWAKACREAGQSHSPANYSNPVTRTGHMSTLAPRLEAEHPHNFYRRAPPCLSYSITAASSRGEGQPL